MSAAASGCPLMEGDDAVGADQIVFAFIADVIGFVGGRVGVGHDARRGRSASDDLCRLIKRRAFRRQNREADANDSPYLLICPAAKNQPEKLASGAHLRKVQLLINPNGIMSLSPGLPQPRVIDQNGANPERCCVLGRCTPGIYNSSRHRHNPFRVGTFWHDTQG